VASQKRDSVDKDSVGAGDRRRANSILESIHKAAVVSNPRMNRQKSSAATITPVLAQSEENRNETEDISVDRITEDRVRGIKGLLGLTPNQSIGDIVSRKFPKNAR